MTNIEKLTQEYLNLGSGLDREQARELALKELKIKEDFEEEWKRTHKRYKTRKAFHSTKSIVPLAQRRKRAKS